MKLIPTPPKVRPDLSVNQGVDAALVMLLFVGVGFLLDRWLGTSPWLLIGCVVLAGVGLFASYKARYDAAMDRHEAERLARNERLRERATDGERAGR
jgi:hypothetical protein